MTTIKVYVEYTILSGILASMQLQQEQRKNDPIIVVNHSTYDSILTTYNNGVIIKKYELDLPYSTRELLKLKLSYGGVEIKAGFYFNDLKEVVVNDGDTINLAA